MLWIQGLHVVFVVTWFAGLFYLLITQPWVVVMMALAVLAVFGVVFGVVLGRERKLGANR